VISYGAFIYNVALSLTASIYNDLYEIINSAILLTGTSGFSQQQEEPARRARWPSCSTEQHSWWYFLCPYIALFLFK